MGFSRRIVLKTVRVFARVKLASTYLMGRPDKKLSKSQVALWQVPATNRATGLSRLLKHWLDHRDLLINVWKVVEYCGTVWKNRE